MDILTATSSVFFQHFDEVIVYVTANGDEREIKAQVIRDRPSATQETGRAITPVTQITVKNTTQSMDDDPNGIGGIASSELDTGGDKIRYAYRIGQTPVEKPIKQIVHQDTGCIVLEVR